MSIEAYWFILVPLLIGVGIALRRWMNIFVLIPATFMVWGGAAILAQYESFSMVGTIGTAFVSGACLQIGYLAGAFVLPFLEACVKKRTAIASRR